MFAHNKRLQYTLRINETNPGLANLMLEQFGGPQGELAAAMRYFTQGLGELEPEEDHGIRHRLHQMPAAEATAHYYHHRQIVIVVLRPGRRGP